MGPEHPLLKIRAGRIRFPPPQPDRLLPMHIGPYALANRVFAAPMAGVTDRPFRRLCKALGAGYAVSEMVTSRRDLWDSL